MFSFTKPITSRQVSVKDWDRWTAVHAARSNPEVFLGELVDRLVNWADPESNGPPKDVYECKEILVELNISAGSKKGRKVLQSNTSWGDLVVGIFSQRPELDQVQ